MTWLATIIASVVGALVVVGLGFVLADSDHVLEPKNEDKEKKQ